MTSTKSKLGEVGQGIKADNARWSFSGKTAQNFSDHVRKSVPLYEIGHDLVCKLSDFFVRDDSVCYELGVSVGDLIAKLARHNHKNKAKWVGVDCEKNMIREAGKNTSGLENVMLDCADINLYEFEKSDFIVSYYTIQFVPPKLRQDLLNKIYESLNWGGAFVWFEKIRGSDARFQDIMTTLYNDYKLENNFSTEEIISKTRSLKGVLEPFSTQGNIDLLKRAGFVDIQTVMTYMCFQGFLAIK
ncbi:MAG: methyltransferase domain-containing protein [Deltaproteobacteria bacterium]